VRLVVFAAVIILVALALEPLLRGWWGRRPPEVETQRDELVKDPVCQTYVVLSRAVTRELEGRIRHFCSHECARRYARGEGRA
jgi:hypothetical protein